MKCHSGFEIVLYWVYLINSGIKSGKQYTIDWKAGDNLLHLDRNIFRFLQSKWDIN